jgi:DNA-binding response OmpR family regulator
MRYYLSIETNVEGFELYKVLWAKLGIHGIMAATMTEGIEKAIELEKSKADELYFIDIVADDIPGYMLQLPILHEETNAPILIATAKYDEIEREEALNNGADTYGAYSEISDQQDVNGVIAVLNSLERRAKKPKPPSKILIYRGIMLAPSYRNSVFVSGEKIDMTRQEFDLLYYLMLNHGKTLSYKQIYKRVWGSDYEDSERNILWNAINRVREKLKPAPDGKEYIETVRDYGYRFPD